MTNVLRTHTSLLKEKIYSALTEFVYTKNYNDLKLFHFSKVIASDFPGKKIKGLIFGNFGAFNYGDEALLSGQLSELQTIKKLQISVVSRFPQNIKKIHKANGVSMLDILAIIKNIFSSDFVIVGGGGLFCKNDGGVIGFLFQIYTLTLFLLLPLLFQKKVYVLGIGFYKNMNQFTAAITRMLLHKVSLVTVRDTYSYEYLLSHGNSAALYKDHSFLMDLPSKQQVLQDPLIKKQFSKKQFHVGIAVKKPKTPRETKKLLTVLTKFIKKNSHDTDFWFFPIDSHAGYHDIQFCHDIIAAIGNKMRMYVMPVDWHPSKFFAAFGLMDYFVSMRFHSLVFSYRNNIPFYGMTYDEKCNSFLESIGKKPITIENISYLTMQQEFENMKKGKSKI